VWIGLCGNGRLIGQFFFERNVNGEAYLEMFNVRVVPALAEHYILQTNGAFTRLWWAQDGAPAHRRIIVMEDLDQLFQYRIISLGRTQEWPPRSTDLTPCDFFLWGYLKSKVFCTPSVDLAGLPQRIRMEAAQIPHDT
jgi:hypothetical protein